MCKECLDNRYGAISIHLGIPTSLSAFAKHFHTPGKFEGFSKKEAILPSSNVSINNLKDVNVGSQMAMSEELTPMLWYAR